MKIPKGHSYRKQVRNGRVVDRQVAGTRAGSRPGRTAKKRYQGAPSTSADGARVLWAVILFGTLVTSGFILALQSEERVHRLGRADANLKADFLDLANRQRVEESRLQEALDAAEREVLERRSRREVVQPSLQRAALPTQLANQVVPPKRERGGAVQGGRRVEEVLPQVSRAAEPPVARRGDLTESPVVHPVVQTRPRRIHPAGTTTDQTRPE